MRYKLSYCLKRVYLKYSTCIMCVKTLSKLCFGGCWNRGTNLRSTIKAVIFIMLIPYTLIDADDFAEFRRAREHASLGDVSASFVVLSLLHCSITCSLMVSCYGFNYYKHWNLISQQKCAFLTFDAVRTGELVLMNDSYVYIKDTHLDMFEKRQMTFISTTHVPLKNNRFGLSFEPNSATIRNGRSNSTSILSTSVDAENGQESTDSVEEDSQFLEFDGDGDVRFKMNSQTQETPEPQSDIHTQDKLQKENNTQLQLDTQTHLTTLSQETTRSQDETNHIADSGSQETTRSQDETNHIVDSGSQDDSQPKEEKEKETKEQTVSEKEQESSDESDITEDKESKNDRD